MLFGAAEIGCLRDEGASPALLEQLLECGAVGVEAGVLTGRSHELQPDGQTVFGGGLNVKIIPVAGQYWETQPLDSSWASLLVQTGLLGLLVAAGWVCWVARGVLRAPYPHRVLFVGLWVFLVGRSLLESGLFDASPAFLLFLAVSLLAESTSRLRLRDEALQAHPAAPLG